MAEPPDDPPKPPPLSPPDVDGLKSFSEDLTKGFEIAPRAALRSIDAEGQVERNVGSNPRPGEHEASSVVTLLELPETEGTLELADRPTPAPNQVVSPGGRSPSAVKGSGFAARQSASSGRWALVLGSGVILGLALLLLFVASRRSGRDGREAATGVPLSVDSVPAGAAIFVDGHETGQKTPATLASWDWLMPHEVQLKLPGRATFQQTIPEGPHPPPLRAILAPVAFLDLQSTPAGAEVRRGDYRIGTTPGHFELRAGETNVLALVLAGHLPATVEVGAAPGELLTRSVTLMAAGTLNLDSDPSGVQTEIDGRPAGRTPVQIELAAGKPHQLRLFAAGLSAEERKVVVAPGQMTSMNVLLGDRVDRELRAQIATTDRRLRAAKAEMQRLDNPHQSHEFFQTMARTRRRSNLETEVDALETRAERLQGDLDSHRSVLEDRVEKETPEGATQPPPPRP